MAISGRSRINAAANVTVTKARKGPFSSTDGLQQSSILGLEWIDPTVAMALPAHRKSGSTDGFKQRKSALSTSDGLEIAVRLARYFGH
jgi:hypothetical protein